MEYQWAEEMNCRVTVCDTEGVIVYMNTQARQAFAKRGDLIGKNLFDCHNEHSQAKIREMLAEDSSNCYTLEKHGVKRMIYQTPWHKEGKVAGLVEISMDVPAEIPNHVKP